MFDDKCLILEDERDRILSIVDIKEFETDMDTIVGQFELIFTEHSCIFTVDKIAEYVIDDMEKWEKVQE